MLTGILAGTLNGILKRTLLWYLDPAVHPLFSSPRVLLLGFSPVIEENRFSPPPLPKAAPPSRVWGIPSKKPSLNSLKTPQIVPECESMPLGC